MPVYVYIVPVVLLLAVGILLQMAHWGRIAKNKADGIDCDMVTRHRIFARLYCKIKMARHAKRQAKLDKQQARDKAR